MTSDATTLADERLNNSPTEEERSYWKGYYAAKNENRRQLFSIFMISIIFMLGVFVGFIL